MKEGIEGCMVRWMKDGMMIKGERERLLFLILQLENLDDAFSRCLMQKTSID